MDEGTVFVTLIVNKTDFPHLPLYPRPIMKWTEEFYFSAFENVPGFQLRENDYVLGEKKFGGNAQTITKNRWLHHTSFLWDYEESRMGFLKIPQKAPDYRQGREHDSFITRMRHHIDSRTEFIQKIEKAVNTNFDVQSASLSSVEEIALQEHPRTTKVLEIEELQKLYFDSNDS